MPALRMCFISEPAMGPSMWQAGSAGARAPARARVRKEDGLVGCFNFHPGNKFGAYIPAGYGRVAARLQREHRTAA
jgi:hypothetical protein